MLLRCLSSSTALFCPWTTPFSSPLSTSFSSSLDWIFQVRHSLLWTVSILFWLAFIVLASFPYVFLCYPISSCSLVGTGSFLFRSNFTPFLLHSCCPRFFLYSILISIYSLFCSLTLFQPSTFLDRPKSLFTIHPVTKSSSAPFYPPTVGITYRGTELTKIGREREREGRGLY